MARFYPDIDLEISPAEFVGECDMEEITELVELLTAMGFVFPARDNVDTEWGEVLDRLGRRDRLTVSEEGVIRTIASRF